MTKKNTMFEALKQRAAELGKLIVLPEDSPLKAMLGLDAEEEDVESDNTEEE